MPSEMEERCAELRKGLAGMPYASIVPDRYPALKYHVGLGRAKAAVGWERPSRYNYETREFEYRGVRGGEIYERAPLGIGWKFLYRVEAGTLPEDLPWRNEG
jgi:hypothetical protein